VFLARNVAREGLAAGDRGKDASFGPGPFEGLDFGVGPARRRRCRRAQHDQELRCRQCRLDLFVKVGAGGKILLVAEDRSEAPWNDAVRGELAGKRIGNAELLELAVQPVGELFVLVAVAQERIKTGPQPGNASALFRLRGAIDLLQSGKLGHGPPPASPLTLLTQDDRLGHER